MWSGACDGMMGDAVQRLSDAAMTKNGETYSTVHEKAFFNRWLLLSGSDKSGGRLYKRW